ncbi:MAG: RNA pseudouridine synthase [Treponema sp. CETP13]|nr:MAG: RNA pseudouridine synthase [Treponema sp. CETP13]
MRLQMYMAHCGVASRRASEDIILEGRVQVNGETIWKLGTKVDPRTVKVQVDGKEIALEEKKRYVLLNKPEGYVCSLSDEKGRPVASDLLQDAFSERLYNVGRLDMFSCGLIMFTNDGEFARKITHPSSQIEKEYVVQTSLPMPPDLGKKFTKGIRIDGVFYKARTAELETRHRLRVTLIEGKNREIRRVLEKIEIGIKKLERVRIGTIVLDGLQPGMFRELSTNEVKDLISLCAQES